MIEIHDIYSVIEAFSEDFKNRDFCVAGGAARDWDLCQPISDIDLFVRVNDLTDFLSLISEIFKVKEYRLLGMGDEDYNVDISKHLVGVAETEFKPGEKLQIIGCLGDSGVETFPLSVFNHFDFGLCEAGFTKLNEFICTDNYIEDKRNYEMTLLRWENPESLKRSLQKHLPKLELKYPSYTFKSMVSSTNEKSKLNREAW